MGEEETLTMRYVADIFFDMETIKDGILNQGDFCVSRNSLHNTHSLIRMRFVWIVVLFFLSSLFVSIRYSEEEEVENRNSTSIPTLQFRRVVHSTPLYYPWDDGFGMLCVRDSHS